MFGAATKAGWARGRKKECPLTRLGLLLLNVVIVKIGPWSSHLCPRKTASMKLRADSSLRYGEPLQPLQAGHQYNIQHNMLPRELGRGHECLSW